MTLGSTQPLNRKEYERYLLGGGGGVKRLVRTAEYLATFMCRLSY
jgi:hypothetical protein